MTDNKTPVPTAISPAAIAQNNLNAFGTDPSAVLTQNVDISTLFNKSTEITGDQADALITSSLRSDLTDWLPNVLNSYNNVTYSFKLYIVKLQDGLTTTQTIDLIDSAPKVILAQSGVTAGYNIKEVTMALVAASPSQKNRNISNVTNFSITIVESMGTSFIETLTNAAKSLGVESFKASDNTFLELSFKGYNEDGDVVTNVLSDSGLSNAGRFVYNINVTGVEVSFSNGTSTYVLNATTTNSGMGKSNPHFTRTSQTINIKGKTIKDMLDDFADKLNKSLVNVYQTQLYTYDFNIHPVRSSSSHAGEDPGTYSLVPDTPDFHAARGLTMDANGIATMQIARGECINDVVDRLFANSSYAQQLAKDVSTQDQTDMSSSQSTTSKFRESVIFRVEPQIKQGPYSSVINAYQQSITYHIFAYSTYKPILSSAQINDAKSPDVQQQILRTLKSKGFMQKRYDYIYTGLNTDVLNVDIHFSLAGGFSAIPQLVKFNGSTDAVTTQAKYNTSTAAISSNYVGPAPTGGAISITPLPTDLTSIGNETLIQAPQLPDLFSDSSSLLPNLPNYTGTSSSSRQNILNPMSDALSASSSASNLTSTPTSSTVYSEDLLNGASDAFSPDIPLIVDTSTHNVGGGMSDPPHRDKSIYGAILNWVYADELGVGYFMPTIDIEIRGDPYWLGYDSVQRASQLDGDLPALDQDKSSANPAESEEYFMVVFNYPYTDGQDGLPQIRAAKGDGFTGLYQMVSVTNTFSNGEFRQTLHGVQSGLLDASKALGASGIKDFKDPNPKEEGTDEGGSGPIVPSGVKGSSDPNRALNNPATKAMADKIYQTFTANGFSRVQALAAVGNAIRESGLDPTAGLTSGGALGVGGGIDLNKAKSVGLFQLNLAGVGSGYTANYLADPDNNINIMMNAARNSSDFMNATTLDGAATAFHNKVEVAVDNYKGRNLLGESIYNTNVAANFYPGS